MNDEHSARSSSVRTGGPRRKRWRAILFGAIILLGGIAIGAGGTVIVLHRALTYAIHHPEVAPERVSERIRRKFDLSQGQTARVKSIIAARQKNLQALRRQWQPHAEKELDGIREDVASILEPDKARRWRERFDALRGQWIPRVPSAEN